MNAIILSGGFGSRLRPLTESMPKPMLPVANRPMLDHVVSQLKAYYINDLIFTLGYRGEQIREFVGGYSELRTRFTVETQPLGTAGAVKSAEKMLSESFIVMSGDALSDVDLDAMIKRHFDSGAAVTMAVTTVEDPSLYGVVRTDELDRVVGFTEKPKNAERRSLINTGIYIIDKSVLALVPENTAFDFSRELFPLLVREGALGIYRHDGYWCDIGDKKSYFDANYKIIRDGTLFEPAERKARDISNEKTSDGNLISSSAIVLGAAKDCIIGANARIASSASIRECVVLDGATVIGEHRRAIIGDGFVEKMDKLQAYIDERYMEANNLLQSSL